MAMIHLNPNSCNTLKYTLSSLCLSGASLATLKAFTLAIHKTLHGNSAIHAGTRISNPTPINESHQKVVNLGKTPVSIPAALHKVNTSINQNIVPDPGAGLVLVISKDAIAVLSLIQPSLDSAQVNLTLIPNDTLSRSPEEPFRLTNNFVHPPVAVDFKGYGDSIPRATADVCLYEALDYALSTRDHSLLTPIDARDLDYTNAKVSLNFHPDAVVIWEEWKNALYLILEFVDRFDTREFLFALEVLDEKEWNAVGKGYLVTF